MSQTPEEIQTDIARQREQLAETVDELGHRLDFKAHTKAKVNDLKTQSKARVAAVKDRSTTDEGKPRPELLGAAVAVVTGLALLLWLRRRG